MHGDNIYTLEAGNTPSRISGASAGCERVGELTGNNLVSFTLSGQASCSFKGELLPSIHPLPENI